MSADLAYGFESRPAVAVSLRKGGPVPEDIAQAALLFIATELVNNPKKLGKKVGGRFRGTGMLSCKRDGFRVEYRIDEVRHKIIIYGIGVA